MKLTLIPALALFAGCATAPVIEHITVDESSAPIRAGVRVLPVSSAAGQPVTARSCRRLAWEPEASAADGIEQLKIKAARLGANAIAGVKCEPEAPGTALSTNCWTAVVCRATAVRAD